MRKELTYIGLGRMGAAMTALLVEKGYDVHGFDVSEDARRLAESNGVKTYTTAREAIEAQTPDRRVVWLMVPAKFVDDALEEITEILDPGDTIIDGGNSFFKESVERHEALTDKQLHFIDCGTSGGVEGARHGASLMVGGDSEAVEPITHIFEALATPGGYGFVGGPGAGHFVKMIHNGIEYGMMGALAEGLNILEEHKDGLAIRLPEALKAYEHGSIISSSLTSWLADSYQEPGYLEQIAGAVPKGETEMEMEYIVQHNRARVLEAALTQRKLTRIEPSMTGTLISAMRNQFGGHQVNKKGNAGQV